eukprot:COSAG01_NODE_7018_length_3391_cov_2.202309_9_plen_136_part_00
MMPGIDRQSPALTMGQRRQAAAAPRRPAWPSLTSRSASRAPSSARSSRARCAASAVGCTHGTRPLAQQGECRRPGLTITAPAYISVHLGRQLSAALPRDLVVVVALARRGRARRGCQLSVLSVERGDRQLSAGVS